MKRRNLRLHLGISLMFAGLSCALAQTAPQTQGGLFELSLDELMQVSVATGDKEAIALTPAVVSSLDYQQMRALGLEKIEDALSFLPGINLQKTAIGTTTIGVRGLVEPFNQKVLFMLDNVPYWQPAHGDNALLGIPLSAIDRIEVIRGPGAVIYGTNASAGVINIITRKDYKKEVEVTLGSQQRRNLQGYGQFMLTDELSLRLSAQIYNEDGFSGVYTNRPQPPFFPSTPPRDAQFRRGQDQQSLLLQLNWRDVSLSYHSFETTTQGLAGPAASTNESELIDRGDLLALNYQYQTEAGALELYTDYNRFFLEIPNENLFGGREFGTQNFTDGNDNIRVRVGANWRQPFTEQIDWLIGVESERRETGEYLQTDRNQHVRVKALPHIHVNESSVFTQFDYASGDWRWMVGARYVNNDNAGSKILPRLSLVKRLSASSSLKFLYASGYNAPNLFQLYINIPPGVVLGSEDLSAETVDSYELAYTHQTASQLLVVNLFYLNAEDFIQRVSNARGTSAQYFNSENFSRRGIELDWHGQWDKVMLQGNISYQPDVGEQRSGDLSAHFMPRWNLSAGINYQMDENSSVGVSWRYLSDRTVASDSHLLNASYQYQYERHHIRLSAENLLAEQLEYADVQDFVTDRVIPGNDGSRLLSVSYGYRFF